MSVLEGAARLYCRSIGVDPDEVIWGCTHGCGRMRLPRWLWYVGAMMDQKVS